MADDDKKELDLEEMDEITGGGDGNTYDNSNNGGKQMMTQGEKNKIENSGTINFGN